MTDDVWYVAILRRHGFRHQGGDTVEIWVRGQRSRGRRFVATVGPDGRVDIVRASRRGTDETTSTTHLRDHTRETFDSWVHSVTHDRS